MTDDPLDKLTKEKLLETLKYIRDTFDLIRPEKLKKDFIPKTAIDKRIEELNDKLVDDFLEDYHLENLTWANGHDGSIWKGKKVGWKAWSNKQIIQQMNKDLFSEYQMKMIEISILEELKQLRDSV